MSASHDAKSIPNTPWEGGGRARIIGLAAAVIGLVLWGVSLAIGGAERAAFSWLWAFFVWLTPVVGALGWLCSFHAAKAKWIILPRRTLEILSATAWIFVLLFIPLVVFAKQLYPWMRPESMSQEAQELFEKRHVWMNNTFFYIRAAIYFVIFIAVSQRLLRWSMQQDTADLPQNTAKSWKLGPGSLPALGFAISFAAFDWMMSTSVSFYSSMFGLYIVGGSAMAAMAMWILISFAVETPMSGHHQHSMGKLLFAFMCFWAYTGFSQFMLIWIADIPEEGPFFHQRIWTDWKWISYFLVLFHFVLPFIILLSKRLKFSKKGLGTMAVWLLVTHAVDLYWIVLPQCSSTTEGPHVSLSDVGAFFGIGGVLLVTLVSMMRGKRLVPVGDPYLPTSMEYHP